MYFHEVTWEFLATSTAIMSPTLFYPELICALDTLSRYLPDPFLGGHRVSEVENLSLFSFFFSLVCGWVKRYRFFFFFSLKRRALDKNVRDCKENLAVSART